MICFVPKALTNFGTGSDSSEESCPSWPNEFDPQVKTFPHSLTATECDEPQHTFVIT